MLRDELPQLSVLELFAGSGLRSARYLVEGATRGGQRSAQHGGGDGWLGTGNGMVGWLVIGDNMG